MSKRKLFENVNGNQFRLVTEGAIWDMAQKKAKRGILNKNNNPRWQCGECGTPMEDGQECSACMRPTKKMPNTQTRSNENSNLVTEDVSDPTKEEMMEFLKNEFRSEFNEDDAEVAIYWFANFNHGGQWSNLYSILSTSPFNPGRMSKGPQEGSMEEIMYQSLESKFTPKPQTVDELSITKNARVPKGRGGKYGVQKPKKDPYTKEWIVGWTINGKYNEEGTFYTDDKQDAIDTYKDMVNRAEKMNASESKSIPNRNPIDEESGDPSSTPKVPLQQRFQEILDLIKKLNPNEAYYGTPSYKLLDKIIEDVLTINFTVSNWDSNNDKNELSSYIGRLKKDLKDYKSSPEERKLQFLIRTAGQCVEYSRGIYDY